MSTSSTPTLPTVSVSGSIGKKIDALVIGIAKSATDGGSPELLLGTKVVDGKAADALRSALEAVDATGATGEVVRIAAPSSLKVGSVVAVGLGSANDDGTFDADTIREAAGNASRSIDGTASAATTLSFYDVGATVEGFLLGAYRFTQFRSEKSAPSKAPVHAVTFLVDKPKSADVTEDAQRAQVIAESVALARDFVNTPPSHLYPEEFAARAQAFGEAAGLEVEVLDYDALVDGGYGGIVGVGKGSSRLPRLVRLTHTAAKPNRKAPTPKTVALVGKGITFDTGGISLKPAANMENMTSDMGGAAAVVASAIAAAKLNVPVNVVATVPMAENMPSDTAQRPGDVLTQLDGTTVEVINTDAEGRLILADAIVRACQDNPDYLIDTATLTGAQMVALGTRTPGVMGTDDFRDRVAELSQAVGENGWPMPLPPELLTDLKSRVADLANVTPHRWGGMLSAGTFLKEFVTDDVQWAHIDVAGPAFNTGSPFGYTGKGGTGVPVRTICAVIDDIAANG